MADPVVTADQALAAAQTAQAAADAAQAAAAHANEALDKLTDLLVRQGVESPAIRAFREQFFPQQG